MFEMAVRKDVYEERQNQLRWQSKVGDDQITLQQKHDIIESRQIAWRDYKVTSYCFELVIDVFYLVKIVRKRRKYYSDN